MVVFMFGFGRRGIAYLGWIALRLTRPEELLAGPQQQKFWDFFDVDAAPGQWQKAR
jgi:hypothetical protein